MDNIIGRCKECDNIIYEHNIMSIINYVYECPKCLTINTSYELYNSRQNEICENYYTI